MGVSIPRLIYWQKVSSTSRYTIIIHDTFSATKKHKAMVEKVQNRCQFVVEKSWIINCISISRRDLSQPIPDLFTLGIVTHDQMMSG